MRNAHFWAAYIERSFLGELALLRTTVNERLLPTFDDLDKEADEVADAWRDQPAGPDPDPEAAMEAAHQAGLEHYLAMRDVKQSFLNLFAVAIHHLLEQQQFFMMRKDLVPLRDENKTSLMKFSEFVKRLRDCGIDLKTYTSWDALQELRLVHNSILSTNGVSGKPGAIHRRSGRGDRPRLRSL